MPMHSMQRQRGAVLIVSLVLLLIITAIAASTLTSSTFQTVVANNAQKRDAVFHVAESAAERVLPITPTQAANARKAAKSSNRTAGYAVTMTTSNQEGVQVPSAKIVYSGETQGMRKLYTRGVGLNIGGTETVVRTYEVQGSAVSDDGKVTSTVVMGVGKVEPYQ